jgi:DMSO reductase family type II enzyme heme b subunit
MLAKYVPVKPEALLEPEGDAWRTAATLNLPLIATPAPLQPSQYIVMSYITKVVPGVTQVKASALHNGDVLAIRLEWSDRTENREIEDTNQFADAAGILLPVKDDAPLLQMGTPEQPVTGWYWSADSDGEGRGRHVRAEGLGTTEEMKRSAVSVRAVRKPEGWAVVLVRSLVPAQGDPVALLEPGAKTKFAVAVWEGSAAERGGLKGYSGDWQPLELAPTA